MTVILTAKGSNWIKRSLSVSGNGSIAELIAAYVATTSKPVNTIEDIQVELSAIDAKFVEAAYNLLKNNNLVTERMGADG